MLSATHSAARPRPDIRERALFLGATELSDVDLVALLLGTGADGESAITIAAQLLDACGGIAHVRRLGANGLAARRGVGPAKAARILAALELGRRTLHRTLLEERSVVASFDHVVEWAEPVLASLEHEEVWLLSLDARNALLGARRIAQGGLHGCALTPRDVLQPALRDGASGLILIHNHPSGDPTPSSEDVQMTRALASACEAVGVHLQDHVVVARGGAESLRDLGAILE